jgi:hypothetical protein
MDATHSAARVFVGLDGTETRRRSKSRRRRSVYSQQKEEEEEEEEDVVLNKYLKVGKRNALLGNSAAAHSRPRIERE